MPRPCKAGKPGDRDQNPAGVPTEVGHKALAHLGLSLLVEFSAGGPCYVFSPHLSPVQPGELGSSYEPITHGFRQAQRGQGLAQSHVTTRVLKDGSIKVVMVQSSGGQPLELDCLWLRPESIIHQP